MLIVYHANNQVLQKLEFALDWTTAIGILLLAKKYVPDGMPFWIVSDSELEVLADIPIEAWEVSGDPDGMGGLLGTDQEEYPGRVKAFQAGISYEEYLAEEARRVAETKRIADELAALEAAKAEANGS